MKNIYETISNQARKYLAPAIVAGALTLGTYSTQARACETPTKDSDLEISIEETVETNAKEKDNFFTEDNWTDGWICAALLYPAVYGVGKWIGKNS